MSWCTFISMGVLNHCVTFNLGSSKVCSGIFQTYSSYHKHIWIAAADYYRVGNLKFPRNLKFATSKTLVNFTKKVMFCLKIGIIDFKKHYCIMH